MKLLVGGLLLALCLIGRNGWMDESRDESVQFVYDFGELESKRNKSNRSYLQFLDVSSMHMGIYTLAAGAKDGQQPHTQDEIYYVEAGVAKINIRGKDFDVKRGSIIFVPAHAPHHFHSIKSDLKTLVFFSKGPIAAAAAKTESKGN